MRLINLVFLTLVVWYASVILVLRSPISFLFLSGLMMVMLLSSTLIIDISWVLTYGRTKFLVSLLTLCLFIICFYVKFKGNNKFSLLKSSCGWKFRKLKLLNSTKAPLFSQLPVHWACSGWSGPQGAPSFEPRSSRSRSGQSRFCGRYGPKIDKLGWNYFLFSEHHLLEKREKD